MKVKDKKKKFADYKWARSREITKMKLNNVYSPENLQVYSTVLYNSHQHKCHGAQFVIY